MMRFSLILLLACGWCCRFANATEQFPEYVNLGENMYLLEGLPLSGYWDASEEESPFKAAHSGLWRGYIGLWRIEEGQLFLLSLYDGNAEKPADLRSIFGYRQANKMQIFARWVSGEFRLARGEEIWMKEGELGEFWRPAFSRQVSIRDGRIVEIRELDGGEDERRELREKGYQYIGLISAEERYRVHTGGLKRADD